MAGFEKKRGPQPSTAKNDAKVEQLEGEVNRMKDVIAEPYRTRLLPGFSQARQAVTEIGALASGISGSGPTLFALCDKPDTAQRVADWLSKNYLQNQEGFVHICRLDTAGARVLG